MYKIKYTIHYTNFNVLDICWNLMVQILVERFGSKNVWFFIYRVLEIWTKFAEFPVSVTVSQFVLIKFQMFISIYIKLSDFIFFVGFTPKAIKSAKKISCGNPLKQIAVFRLYLKENLQSSNYEFHIEGRISKMSSIW